MRWFRSSPLAEVRWVVIDTETSGLDAARDRLLSVGAVAVRGGRIALGESFAALVGQDEPSAPGNIAVHGIGADAQRSGEPPQRVLAEFSRFLGAAAPVGFDAGFDAAILRRAARPFGVRVPRRWLDLAALAPALDPERARLCRSLDEWLAAYGVQPLARHDALGDAFATAELFLMLLARAGRQGCGTERELFRLAGSRRWLGAGN